MEQIIAPIIRAEDPMPAGRLVVVTAPRLAADARPGQFVLLRQGPGWDPLLRAPLYLQRLDRARGEVWLLALVGQPGHAALRAGRVGEKLDIIGPCGTGYTLPQKCTHVALLGQATHAAPLIALAHHLAGRGVAVTLAIEASSAALIYPGHLLPAEVEYRILSPNGETGEPGDIAAFAAELAEWADAAVCAGSLPWLLELRDSHPRFRQKQFAHALVLPEVVPCGVGACQSCAVPTRRGPRLACVEGPAFPLTMLEA